VATLGVSVPFVNRDQYTANKLHTLCAAAVDSYFPNNHTHTNPAGANVAI
jgi:rhamnogalacturonan acetylesterase